MAASQTVLSPRPQLLVEELEARILYSADAAALLGLSGARPELAEVRVFDPANHSAAPAAQDSRVQAVQSRELIFVDSRVPDAIALADELIRARGGDRSFDIVILHADTDGVAQISKVLAAESGLAAIHIISHGSDGAIAIGDSRLDADRLALDGASVARWGDALAAGGDLLLYGCQVAEDVAGRAFVQQLALLTGADVAASTDATGSGVQGTNWTLEHASGRIEAASIDAASAAPGWTGRLAIDVASTTSAMTTNASSLTFSHTIGTSANRMLMVSVGYQSNSGSVTGITYDGRALTLLGSAQEGGGGLPRTELWYLEAPPAGTANVVVSMSAGMAMTAGATSFYGVHQTTSFGAVATAIGDNHLPTVTVSSAPGELVIDSIEDRSGATGSVGPGQVERYREITGSAGGDSFGASSTESGAASVTMSWSLAGSGAGGWAAVAVSLKPAPNTAPTLVDGTVVTLPAINENADSAGVTVAGLLGSAGASDPDFGAASGIAVTSAIGNGSWQYSTNGTTWTDFGTVSAASSLLLDGASQVRYAADRVNGETASFTFKAWDQTTGTASAAGSPAHGTPGSGGGDSAYSAQSANTVLTVAAVNDAPTLSAGGTLAYTENDAASKIDPALSVSDVDSATLSSATVAITTGYTSGQDSLVFTNQNNISGNWDPATGVLTLTGAASVADYQAALRSVAYSNASDDPSTAARSVTFTVNDGSASSAPATATVTVSAVNDAPTATTGGSALVYTENQAATLIDPSLTLADLDNTTLASATVRISGGFVAAEDVLAFTNQSGISGSWNAATGGLTLSGSASIAQYQAALRSVTYRNTSEDPSALTRTVSFQVNDGALDSTAATVDVNVAPLNDAPVLDNSGAPTLPTITKSQTSNGGQTVAGIIASAGGDRITDVDSGALEGIAVTALASGNGTWQYSVDGGGSWTGIGAVSGTSALLLRDSDLVRFVPNGVSPTTASFDFRAWDRSTGSVGTKVDVSTNGGSSAFSTAVETANITVVDINSAPVLDSSKSPALNAINEDAAAPSGAVGSLVSQLVDFATPAGQVDNVSDVDGGAALGIAITAADTTQGSWFYSTNNGTNWNPLGAVSTTTARLLAADANTRLFFQPNVNVHGALPAAITFHAWDQSSGLNGDTASLQATQTVLDRFSVASYANNDGTAAWSTSWVEVDGGLSSPDNGAIRVFNNELRLLPTTVNDEISRGANLAGASNVFLSYRFDSTAMTSGDIAVQVSSDGGASYTTLKTHAAGNLGIGTDNFDISANASANTRIRFLVTSPAAGGTRFMYVDDVRIAYTQTAGGSTAFSSASDTASLVVSPVADTPSITSATTNEDTQSASGLVIARNAADGAEVTHYKITSIANGTLYQNDGVTAIANGSFITAAAGGAGLRFTPASNFNGLAGFTVQASMSGSDAGLGGATVNASITVLSVNDAPAGTSRTVTTPEDTAHAFTLADFGFSDASDTPANALLAVRISTLPAAGSLTWNNGSSDVAVTVGQLVSAADITAGRLRFTPAANANGTGHASFTFQVQDSGGTANGGVDLDPTPKAFTIDVTPVNDAPVITTSNSSLAYPIGTPARPVDPALTISDVDHVNLVSASVGIVGGYVSGLDQLSFVGQSGITGSWVAATGVLNLTGTATVAQYQAALGSITFQSTSASSGARLISFTTSDGATTSTPALRSITVGQEIPALWLSSVGDSVTSASSGGLRYSDGQVARLSNPNLVLGSGVTNGSFTGVFDIDSFAGSNANINGLHVVHSPVSVGSVNPVSLQRGDILLTVRANEVLGGVAVGARDIVRFRPTSSGDYSSGSFAVVLRDPLGGTDLRDFALVETAMTIGNVSVQAGDFLLVGTGGAYDKDITLFRPTTMSTSPTGGTRSVLIDGDNSPGTDFNKQISGVELVQHDTTLGGVALTQGQLLVTINGSANAGVTRLAVDMRDVFVLSVSTTGHATSSATATMLMRGADLGLTGGSEELDALALVGVYNTAPVLDSARSPSLTSVDEDSVAPVGPVGTLVSALVDTVQPAGQNDNVTDPDTDAQLGIAVIVADTASGSWWYSTDNGAAWNALGAVSNASAKLLAADASTRLYFRPNADFAGSLSSAITFRAWDRTVGSNGVNHNTTGNGGTTAFSADFDTAQLTVSSINDAPLRTSAAPAAIVANEDSASGAAVSLGLGSLTYAPGGGADEASQTLTAQITAIPASVTLWLADGTTAVPVGSTLTMAQLQGLRYRTVPNANGAALLTWTLRDSGGTVNGGVDSIADSVSITINPVNDAPVLSGSNELDGINQNPPTNAGTLVSELIAGRVADADAGALAGIAVTAVDNTNGSWQYSRDGGASWTAFGTPTVGAARLLAADASTFVRFAPNANWVGQVSPGLTFRAWDQTSGTAGLTADTNANGATSAFSSALASASIQVSAWPVIFTGSYSENFTSLGTSGTQMAVGYRAMQIAGSGSTYDAGTPISAAGVASATIGNQNLLVWKPGDFNILAGNRLANAGSIGNLADRALATGPTGNAATVIELALRNATAGPLASVQFGYDLKVLADGENGDTEAAGRPGYAFFYSLTGGTSAAEWISVPALATTATTLGSVTSVSARIDFAAPLAAGSMMYFRWADDNADNLSPDQNFGVDNVSVQRINAAPVLSGIEPAALVWQEEAAATPVSSTIAVADIDDANLGGATVAITANHASGQDLLVFTDQNGISGSWDAASGVLTLTGSSSLANYQAALRSVAYVNTSDAPSTASRTVTFSVRDAGATSNLASRTVEVLARNDAPVLSGSNDLPAINRNPATNPGMLVADLLAGQVSDPDATGALRGIAVTTVDNVNGSWQYSLDGGASWTALGAPGDAGARLLAADATTRVRFVPATDWTGVVSGGLRFRAWDQTSGSAGTTADVRVNGGSTAFSSATAAASISVGAANTAPVLSGANPMTRIAEDAVGNTGTSISALVAGRISDADPGALAGIAVVAVDNSNGSWQYSTDGGGNWLAFGTPSGAAARLLAADANTFVRFVPAADFNGTVGAGITFKAWDRSSGVAGTTVDLTSTTTVRDNFSAVAYDNNDGSARWSTPWLDVDSGPIGGSYRVHSGQLEIRTNNATDSLTRQVDLLGATSATLSFDYVSDLDNGSGGRIDIQVSNNGGASYTSLASFTPTLRTGTGSFSADIGAWISPQTRIRFATLGISNSERLLVDNVQIAWSSTGGGDSAFSTASAAASIAVDAVNDAPVRSSAAPAAISAVEDSSNLGITSLGLAGLAYGPGGASDEASQTLSYTVTAVPPMITAWLADGSTPVSAGSTLTLAQLRGLGYRTEPNANGSGNLTWTVRDSGGTALGGADTLSQSLAITIMPVNDAPVLSTGGSSLGYLENQAATPVAPALTLGDIDNATLASAQVTIAANFAAGEDRLVFTNQNGITGSFNAATGVLDLSGVSSLVNYQAALRSVAYFNSSDNPSGLTRTVSFVVNDGALASTVETTDVTVSPVNDAPVIAAGGGQLAYTENQAAAAIDPALTLADVDNTTLAAATVRISGNFAAGEDRLVFSDQNGIVGSFDAAGGVLSLSGVSSLANYQAALRSVAYLNTSDNPSGLARTVSFTVSDGALTSNVATTVVNVAPVNDAPFATASGGSLAYVENQAASPVDPALTLADVDHASLASATVRISGNFAPGEDRLVFADQNGISGSFDAASGVLSLGGVSTVANYQAALQSVAYSNVSDNPSALTRTVSFMVNDGALASNLASRDVLVTPVNDAPVTATSSGTVAYTENQPATAIDPALTLSDDDHTTLASATVRISGNFESGEDRLVFAAQNGISGSFDATTGVLSLTGPASLAHYQTALRSVAYLNTSDDPSALTRTVSFMVNDGALGSNVASRDVLVTPVNDAPVTVTSGGSLSYTENQSATVVDAGLTLADLDNTTLASATVRISGNFASGEDRLVFVDQNGISGSFDAATGVLALTGPATVSNYQAALRSVAYLNTSDDPSALTRTVSFMVDDGALGSNAAGRDVQVTPVNDAPVTTTSGGSLAYVENQSATPIDPALTLADSDHVTLASATIRIAVNFVTGEDRLVFADQNGISGSFDATTGTLSLTGSSSIANYQAALRSVAYLNTSDDPSALTRTVSFSVNDGALVSNVANRGVTVTPVNDAPVVTSAAGSATYTENQSSVTVDPALTLSDLDDSTLASATVAITVNFAPGEDRLAFANQNGITGSFDAATGVLSLSGVSSVANYQSALRSVTYLNTSDDPSGLARTVSFSVSDGALTSNAGSRDVTVTPVNDAPIVAAGAGTASYVENQSAVSVDPGLSLADIDSATLASATVAITGNFAAGEDRLVFADQNGIVGSFDAATGVLSLTGVSSVANYQAALRSVAYLNTSDDPNGLTRTVSFSVNDGALASNVASGAVVVTPVNDAPVVIASTGTASFTENQSPVVIDPALTLADVDNLSLASATVAITGQFATGEDLLVFTDQNGITGSFDATTGVLSLTGSASVSDYQTALRSVAYLNTSDDPSALVRTVSFMVSDGALQSSVSSRSLAVTPVNDAPVTTGGVGNAAYTENQLPVPVDPALTLADLDDTSLDSATVAITGNFIAGEDRLAFVDQDGITGSFDAATGVLSLSGVSSVANYQTALRSVVYLNTSDDPSGLARTVSFSVNDGALVSNAAMRAVVVTPVNDAPVATTTAGAASTTENQPAVAIDPTLTLADVDSTTLTSATVAITGNFAAGEDRLVFADQNGITGSFDAGTGVLSLSGISSVASYQAALRSVAYLNTSDDPSGLTRNVSFSVHDGALSSGVVSRSVGVTPVNDAPVVITSAGTASYTENQSPVVIDPALTLADVDNLSLASATVAITGQFAGGEDRLVFADQNGISGSFDAATGVLSLTGSASVADYQAALRSVAYLNTSDDPSALTRTVSFSVSDGALESALATRSVGFTAVNDAPVAGSGGGSLAYTENQAATVIDPALTLADVDNTVLASATVTISGNFAVGEDRLVFADQNGISGSFDAATGVLTLTGFASVADYQDALRSVAYLNTSDDPNALTRTVSFSVNDGALDSNVASRSVGFTPVNDAPVASAGAGLLVYIENQAATAVDPAITLVDVDNTTLASATVTISGNFAAGEDRLVFADQSGIGGAFDASTGVLRLNGVASVADYQAALRSVAYLNTSDDPSALTRTVSFSVSDGALESALATRSVGFTAVNDAPVAGSGGGSLAYTENQAATAIDPALTLADVDNTVLASATVTISGNFAVGEDRLVFADQNGISGSFDAATGVLTLTGFASVADYQDALRSVAYLNTSDDPNALTRTVSFSVNDGALDSNVASRSVGFTPVNDAPVASAGAGSLVYIENQAATAVDPAITLVDVDNTTLASATVAISGNFAEGEDHLVFADQNGIVGAFDAATGVLSLSGVASVADYQAALRSVAYLNTSDDPSALTRTVSFSVFDGALGSNVASRDIGFFAVNDAPVLAASAGSLVYTENQAATPVDAAIKLSDVDNTTLTSATVAISGNFAAGEDRLVFIDQNGITGSFNASTGVLSLSGVASVADYQAALRLVAYQNTSEDPGALARTVSFSVNDGALESSFAVRSIGFTAVNDGPVTATGGGSLAYTENQPATAIDPALTLSDVDNTVLASATVGITGNFASGEDRLVFADQNGISGSFDAATGVLTLRGTASVGDYQTALRSVAYLNTSDDPSASARTVSFSVDDGELASRPAHRVITLAPINDAPVVIPSAGAMTYTENQVATPVDPTVSLADLDDVTLASATVAISSNFSAGEDRLAFTDQNGIAGSFDEASGVLRLSGTASLADYEAALRTVTYVNTSDDPSGLTRTVSFSVSDASLESAVVSRSVSVVAVGDPPTSKPIVLDSIKEDSGPRTITQSELLAAAGDLDSPTLRAERLVIATGGGQLVDNGDGSWTYNPAADDDGEVTFSYIVSDPVLTTAGRALLDLTPVDDAPLVALSTLLVQGGSRLVVDSTLLQANDTDNLSSALSFVVVDAAHGRFELVDAPGTPVERFTQSDVDAGRIALVSTSASQAPDFRIAAYDGNSYSGMIVAKIDFRRTAFASTSGDAGVLAPVLTEQPVVATVQSAPSAGEATTPKSAQSADSTAGDRRRIAAVPGEAISEPVEATESSARVSERSLSPRASAAERLQRPRAGDVGQAQFDLAARISVDDYVTEVAEFELLDLSQQQRNSSGRGLAVDARSEATGTSEETYGELDLGQAAAASGLVLSAGTIWWALRAGSLLTGLMVSLPAWRHADLLAVLPDEEDEDAWESAEDHESARDERAVDRVFESGVMGEQR